VNKAVDIELNLAFEKGTPFTDIFLQVITQLEEKLNSSKNLTNNIKISKYKQDHTLKKTILVDLIVSSRSEEACNNT